MGVAHTLSRTFFWTENILWKEDLSAHRTIVFLGAKDSILNAAQVRTYLQGTGQQFDQETVSKDREIIQDSPQIHGQLSVVWCDDLDHGQVFDLPEWRTRLQREILKEVVIR